jgi:tRNA(Ile)-lysidine synthase TilS/MesJ
MKPRRENRVKPLLDFSKALILDFLKQNCIDFKEDGSNAKNFAQRNQIRNLILPVIREHFSSAEKKFRIFRGFYRNGKVGCRRFFQNGSKRGLRFSLL